MIILEKDIKYNSSLTWNNSWVSNYESIWSIFEKIKIANNISNKEIYHLLTYDSINHCSKDIVSNCNSIIFSEFNDKPQDLLCFDFNNHQNKIRSSLFGSINTDYLTPSNIFKKDIAICSKCIQNNYHSVLHQLIFLNFCPFHHEPLVFLYNDDILINNSLNGFFQNDFSEEIYVEKTIYYINSKKKWQIPFDKVQIKCNLTRELIDYNINFDNKVKRNIFFEPNLFLNREDALEKFNCILLNSTDQCNSESVPTTFVSPAINKRDRIFAFTQENFQSLYYSTQQTFRSIVRHLKSTYLLKHKKCLKSLLRNHPERDFCPYSYAYVHWRKFVEGHTNISEVELGKRIRKKNLIFTLKFIPIKNPFIFKTSSTK